MKTNLHSRAAARLLRLLAVCLSLAACGGGGGDAPPPEPAPPNSGWIDIWTVSTADRTSYGNASFTTMADIAQLWGTAFISPDGGPTYADDPASFIFYHEFYPTIEWQNADARTHGEATNHLHISQIGSTYYLWGIEWSASIPLAVGANRITVRASDPSGHVGEESLTITRLRETIRPTVSATDPPNGATGVALNATLTATFSERLDPASVTSSTFKVAYGGIQVPGSVTYLDRRAQFTPTNAMPESTMHTAMLTTGIRDESGNALASDQVWTFTTGTSSDVAPPVVTDIVPSDGTTCFPPDGTLTATFSETLDTSTVGPTTFLLSGASGTVSGNVSLNWDGVTASFAPYGQLASRQTYTATLSGQIKDLAGNAMGADRVWSFTTAPAGAGTWQPTASAGAPTSRSGHTVVWTGTEMIVWGGSDAGSGLRLADGGRYDPATDTWTAMSPALIARTQHVAVWTGTEMLAWGGFGTSTTALPSTGAIYSPATDSWRAMSATGAPSGRTGATAVWTGTEMIIWGGYGQGPVVGTSGPVLGDGARYNPATDTWQPVSATNAPEPRSGYSVVWTGSRMIIWGGMASSGLLYTGAAYDPATDTWQPLSTAGTPAPRMNHSGSWTGSEMIVWGGSIVSPSNYGGRYDPGTDTWRLLPIDDCAPSPRQLHAAVWTGSELIVWGGVGTNASVGGRFSPTSEDWRPMSVVDQPAATTRPPPAIWTGSEMIVWTGYGAGSAPGSGGRYRP